MLDHFGSEVSLLAASRAFGCPSYYSAFVPDGDGNDVEAVTHRSE